MITRFIALFTLFNISIFAHAAVTGTFDFEDVAPSQGVNNRVDFTGPLTLTNNGFSMTIRHENEIVFSFNERIGVNIVAQFGSRMLSAFNGNAGGENPGAFLLDFDQPLTSVIVEMGDIGQDADNLLLQAYSDINGTGTLLDSDTGFLVAGGNTFGFDTLTVAAPGIRSLRIIGGSNAFPNSVFYDNIVITAIPEPSSFAAFFFVGAISSIRRRRVDSF